MGFTVHDVALLLGIMAGYDERDNLSSSTVTPVQAARRDDFDTAATIPTVTPKDYTTFTSFHMRTSRISSSASRTSTFSIMSQIEPYPTSISAKQLSSPRWRKWTLAEPGSRNR